MGQSNRAVLLALAVLVAAFGTGLVQLFRLGIEEGEIYPAYSSFRSDPLGARALYGALAALPGVTARRNLDPILLIGPGPGKLLLIAGADLSKDPENVIRALETFVASGGRLVIAFYPLSENPDLEEGETPTKSPPVAKDKKPAKGKFAPPKPKAPPLEPGEEKMVSIEERWGFAYGFAPLPGSTACECSDTKPADRDTAMRQTGPDALPVSLPWHSALFFYKYDPRWQTLYARSSNRPVLIQRPWGRGSLVLVSDSYLFSNEAMRRDRKPEWLSWVIGPATEVIFDEFHLGVEKPSSLMTLLRGYRLDRVILAFALVAGLFVWRNAGSLTPRRDPAVTDAPDRGRDSSAGLVNLLRRSIPARNLLAVCLQEWRRSGAADLKKPGSRQARVQAIVAREQKLPLTRRDPVAAYRQISKILAEKDGNHE